jgi:hypothetical protein
MFVPQQDFSGVTRRQMQHEKDNNRHQYDGWNGLNEAT